MAGEGNGDEMRRKVMNWDAVLAACGSAGSLDS